MILPRRCTYHYWLNIDHGNHGTNNGNHGTNMEIMELEKYSPWNRRNIDLLATKQDFFLGCYPLVN